MARALPEMPDPRLVALGLVPEPVIEPVPATLPEIPPLQPADPVVVAVPAPRVATTPAPAAAVAPRAPAPPIPAALPAAARVSIPVRLPRLGPVAPPRVDATPVAPPRVEPKPLPHSEVFLRTEVIVGRQHAELALERLGLRMTGASPLAIAWAEVSSIDVVRGRVRIRTGDDDIDLIVAMDGVAEPRLAAPFAQVVRDVSNGRFERDSTAAVQLQNAVDRVHSMFRESDDATLTLIVGAAGVFGVLALTLGLPSLLFVMLRPTVARDAFLLASVMASFDPRVIATALAGGALVASLVARITLGDHVGPWTRGTLRDWHTDTSLLVYQARRALAVVIASPLIAAAVFAAALLTSLPSARVQTTVDPRGVHAFGPLPFFDRDSPWAEVTDVVKIPASGAAHPDGFTVEIRANDARLVSTADLRLQNGMDAYFFDLVNRWRGVPAR